MLHKYEFNTILKDEIPQEITIKPEIKLSVGESLKSALSGPIEMTKEQKERYKKQADMVKELREITGAGVMDCKKALNATEWSIPNAIEYLRNQPPIATI